MVDTIEAKPILKNKTKSDITEPSKFNIIYLNDDVTTFEFVVETLVVILGYDSLEAETMAKKIHDENSAVVATLPYEMAEQKGYEVTLLARNRGFPLIVKLEMAD
jgi:ATP-dependent Clp protease adaptor protein ClpS